MLSFQSSMIGLRTETGDLLENSKTQCWSYLFAFFKWPSSHLIQQNELNDLVWLKPTKTANWTSHSRLQEWNLLVKGTNITSFRKINANFSVFYILWGFNVFMFQHCRGWWLNLEYTTLLHNGAYLLIPLSCFTL